MKNLLNINEKFSTNKKNMEFRSFQKLKSTNIHYIKIDATLKNPPTRIFIDLCCFWMNYNSLLRCLETLEKKGCINYKCDADCE